MDATSLEEPRVCPPDHGHGRTSTCYSTHGCRCNASCRPHERARKARIARDRAYGRHQPALVPATRALIHATALSRFGYTPASIARWAGIDESVMYAILNGKRQSILRETHTAILSVRPTLTGLTPYARVPAEPSRRRVQALACNGWSLTAIANRMGVSDHALRARIGTAFTTVESHQALATVYDELWDKQPPAPTVHAAQYVTRTKNRALAAGWVPPLAWDDIDTDPAPPLPDEDDGIDTVAITLAVEGGRVALTREERLLAVQQLHAAGHGDRLIAHMLMVSDKTIGRDREHLGLTAHDDPTPLTRKLAA